jgi:RNA polymerase sigma-70 factor (ECF subfamily)
MNAIVSECESLSETTFVLVQQASKGDRQASDRLMNRFLPLLRRWAHGRLPRHLRDIHETDDLVQITLTKALSHIGQLHSQRRGAFLQYLCQSLLNQVRDEIRQYQRRKKHLAPYTYEVAESVGDEVAPIQRIFGVEEMHAYDQALSSLSERQQRLVLMRLEFGMSYSEIAYEVRSTPDAVRMMIGRALVQLSRFLIKTSD